MALVQLRLWRLLHASPLTATSTLIPTSGNAGGGSSSWGPVRFLSEEQLNASTDSVGELFKNSITNKSRKLEGLDGRPVILTTRREALGLYREVLRYSNLFVWKDKNGVPWRDIICVSARKEFEDARYETDPTIISKLIITGRDAVQRSVEVFMAKRKKIIDSEAAQGHQQGPGPFQ